MTLVVDVALCHFFDLFQIARKKWREKKKKESPKFKYIRLENHAKYSQVVWLLSYLTFSSPNNLSSCLPAPASSALSCQRQRRWIRVRCGVSSPAGCHDLHCAVAWPPVVRVPLPGWPFCAPRPGCGAPGRVGAALPFVGGVLLLVVHETFALPTPIWIFVFVFQTQIFK